MEIIVARKPRKSGSGTYLVLMAVAPWGSKVLTYDEGTILSVIPTGVDHRALGEKGVVIGKIAVKI